MKRLGVFLFFLLGMAGTKRLNAQESLDSEIVAQIRDQAFNHSQVMDIAFHLTDASGSRLTNSPGWARAAHWAEVTLTSWGLSYTTLEPWGVFGRSWEVRKMYLAMTEPYYKPLIAFPGAWTEGSHGPFQTELMLYHPQDSISQASFIGHLKGKLVITYPSHDALVVPFIPEAKRYTDSDLYVMAHPVPEQQLPAVTASVRRPPAVRKAHPHVPRMVGERLFFQQEGILGELNTNRSDRDGTVFVGGGGPHETNVPLSPMNLQLSYEDYHLLVRLLEDSIPVRLEGDVDCRSLTNDSIAYNVVAEIPGVDPVLSHQLVILGAHLDSWQGATGATDNGAGSAVMLEAVRILQTLHIRPRRTIRIVLWSGEEEGLLGSTAYVKTHFVTGDTTVSAYYNLDNGTGRIRGIYLQQDSAAGPVFAPWLTSFKDLGASTIAPGNTGGTDHESFAASGFLGFQFIQDPIEYYRRTHHSNMDTYDHLLSADLQQAACIIAAFAYQTAMRQLPIPRMVVVKVQ